MFALQAGVVETTVDRFVADLLGVLPDIFAGIVFLVVAYVLIKIVMFIVNTSLKRVLTGEEPVYRQFVSTIIAVFLWFGVALSFLSIVGLDQIAGALGTATGFLALGVSYALSGMLADAVAGIYLLRDPDFMPGDTVDIGGTVGVVKSIELRKTRVTVGQDTVVRANAEIEKKWTKVDDDD